MAERQCDKCGETVDAARAFCPSCGEPFVTEEKREQQSNYDRMDHTVQMGKTMYGQMLSDMGLNISKPQGEKRVEVIAPVGAPAKQDAPRPDPPKAQQAPVEPPKAAPAAPAPVQATPGKSKAYLVWGLLGAGILLIGFLVVLGIAIAFYWYSLRRG